MRSRFGLADARPALAAIRGRVAPQSRRRAVCRALAVGFLGLGVASVAPAELRLYVANAFNASPADATVSVIRLGDRVHLADIDLPTTSHAHSVAVLPNGLKAYVTGENFAITVIDTLTNSVLHEIATPENLSAGLALIPGSSRGLVCMRTGNVVRRFDTTTDTLVGAAIGTSPGPQAVVVKANGTKAYVLAATAVDVIDLTLAVPMVTASVPLGAGTELQEIALNSAETLVYVTDAGNNKLRVIRTSDNTEVTPAFFPAMTDFPRSLSVDNTYAYVGLRLGVGTDSVWVVRLSDGAVVEQIHDPNPFGGIGNPRKSVRSPDGSRLYVSAHTFDWVAEIDLVEYCYKYIYVGTNPVGLAIADVPVGASTDGQLDTRFSGDGRLVDDLGAGAGFANGVAVQCDGKTVVVGSSNGATDMAVARYDVNGARDTTFSGDGFDLRDFGGGIDEAQDVAIQPDGKIVVAGTAASGGMDRFAVLRYLPDGTLDGSFGAAGVALISFGAHSQARALAIQADGRIVVAGRTDSLTSIAVARLTGGGVLDPTFNGTGKATLDFGGDDQAWDVAIQPDGKIVVAGAAAVSTVPEMIVVRYTAAGAIDFSFGGPRGYGRASFGGASYGHAVAIQPDGKIVVAGSTAVGSSIAVARFDGDGYLDPSFACNGTDRRDFFWGVDEGWDVALRSDGRILVSGSVTLDTLREVVVLRYLEDGTLDWTLRGNGYVAANFGNDSYGRALAKHTDGTLAVAGYRSSLATPTPALLRILGWSDLVFPGGFEPGSICGWSTTGP